ncbi:MAG TPA: ShlB/FhaC/HecB family hemolysin secretion/activation protein [Nitrospirales bacterium]|nr:ShlB/FhaC/HecB family hemolysin secretion/activation protein [Nitrospirales bacterium]
MADLLGSASLPPQVSAQVPPTPDILLEQQRQGEKQKKLQEELTQPPPPPRIDKPPKPPAPKAGEAKLKVTRITFSGNTVLATTELEGVVAPVLGKELTLRELNDVAALVSNYYATKGYILAQAYLPPQEIREGVVEIAVLEGKLGTIEVRGNKRYTMSTILAPMGPVQRLGVIHEATLETALNELNDYPGLNVRAALMPGKTRGLTDLELTAQERIPYSLSLDVNNYGSRLTGPWLYGTEIGIGNIFGIGDNLTLRGTKSNTRLFFTNIGYLIPVTSFGTKVNLNWTHSENVVGEEFGALRPTGRADVVSADVLQTITRTSGFSLTANGGFDFKTYRNIVSGTLSSKDELRVFRVGVRGDYRDPFRGRTSFGLTVHQGVDFWGASTQNAPGTSFATAAGGAGPGTWTKATADLARFQSLGFPIIQNLPVLPDVLNDSYLILRASGQIASDRLLSPERFSIGGYYTVRGYPISERIGDNGYTGTAEMVVPIPSASKVPFSRLAWKEMFQVAAFVDHGGVFSSPVQGLGGEHGRYLTGAGGGLRINVPFGVPEPVDRGNLSLKIDWASAIGRPRPSSRDQGIILDDVAGHGAAGVLYISGALRF